MSNKIYEFNKNESLIPLTNYSHPVVRLFFDDDKYLDVDLIEYPYKKCDMSSIQQVNGCAKKFPSSCYFFGGTYRFSKNYCYNVCTNWENNWKRNTNFLEVIKNLYKKNIVVKQLYCDTINGKIAVDESQSLNLKFVTCGRISSSLNEIEFDLEADSISLTDKENILKESNNENLNDVHKEEFTNKSKSSIVSNLLI